MDEKPQTPGRQRNAAQPLGERAGLVSERARKKTAEAERRAAGPDGPDAAKTARPPPRTGPTGRTARGA